MLSFFLMLLFLDSPQVRADDDVFRPLAQGKTQVSFSLSHEGGESQPGSLLTQPHPNSPTLTQIRGGIAFAHFKFSFILFEATEENLETKKIHPQDQAAVLMIEAYKVFNESPSFAWGAKLFFAEPLGYDISKFATYKVDQWGSSIFFDWIDFLPQFKILSEIKGGWGYDRSGGSQNATLTGYITPEFEFYDFNHLKARVRFGFWADRDVTSRYDGNYDSRIKTSTQGVITGYRQNLSDTTLLSFKMRHRLGGSNYRFSYEYEMGIQSEF